MNKLVCIFARVPWFILDSYQSQAHSWHRGLAGWLRVSLQWPCLLRVGRETMWEKPVGSLGHHGGHDLGWLPPRPAKSVHGS